MTQHQFTNALRSLFNIDGYLLPELTDEQQREFVRDPVRYLIRTDKAQQDAIWREVSKRQATVASPLLVTLEAELNDLNEDIRWAQDSDLNRLIARRERMEAAITGEAA
jgi:hypothetical protein